MENTFLRVTPYMQISGYRSRVDNLRKSWQNFYRTITFSTVLPESSKQQHSAGKFQPKG